MNQQVISSISFFLNQIDLFDIFMYRLSKTHLILNETKTSNLSFFLKKEFEVFGCFGKKELITDALHSTKRKSIRYKN
jgi:hypothetical protein